MDFISMGMEASSVVTSMTSGLQGVVTDVLAGFAALAPIALGIFAAKFVWGQGVQFFSKLGKKN